MKSSLQDKGDGPKLSKQKTYRTATKNGARFWRFPTHEGCHCCQLELMEHVKAQWRHFSSGIHRSQKRPLFLMRVSGAKAETVSNWGPSNTWISMESNKNKEA